MYRKENQNKNNIFILNIGVFDNWQFTLRQFWKAVKNHLMNFILFYHPAVYFHYVSNVRSLGSGLKIGIQRIDRWCFSPHNYTCTQRSLNENCKCHFKKSILIFLSVSYFDCSPTVDLCNYDRHYSVADI